MKVLRTYVPEDRARERAARAFADGLDAAGATKRTVADEIGRDEKTVRMLCAGERDAGLCHLLQLQSDTAFEEIVEALRAERAKIHGDGLSVPREAAAAGVGGACTTAVQSVLGALRDGHVSDEEVEEIDRALAEVKRHHRALRTSRDDGRRAS